MVLPTRKFYEVGWKCDSTQSTYYSSFPFFVRSVRDSFVAIGENDDDGNSGADCRRGVCAPPVQKIYIKSVIIHSDYANGGHLYDISLGRLAHDINFNGEKQTIPPFWIN